MNKFSGQVKEVVNRNTFVSLALAHGYNAYLPVYDGGIDFIIYRETDGIVRKIQLKSRWSIDKKYLGRDLWIAFPMNAEWYLAPHDAMLQMKAAEKFLLTASWTQKGQYFVPKPSRALLKECESYRFGSIEQVAAAAEERSNESISLRVMERAPTISERIRGCLLGGAIGDAVGAPIEFMSIDEIRRTYGRDGLRTYAPAYGRIGAITDDTQMTLFTAEGLIRARVRAEHKGMCHPPSVIHHAYLRWLQTQGERSPATKALGAPDGWLINVEALHYRRAPGNTCLSALSASESLGTPERARNESKGCGGVMRVAPVGLFASIVGDDREVFDLAATAAGMTHGHPSGYLAAGYLGVAVAGLTRGQPLDAALDAADAQLRTHDGAEEVIAAISGARRLAGTGRPTPEQLAGLGGGWVAEEALAIAICCALVAEDFSDGVLLAANHSGDSDSTAAIAGNVLGAQFGIAGIAEPWLKDLELRAEIERIADDLISTVEGRTPDFNAYPGW